MGLWGKLCLAGSLVLLLCVCDTQGGAEEMESIPLPEPSLTGEVSVEQAISRRRSRREFTDKPLSLEQLGQVLWAAQGITGEGGRKRAAPSAGATYPMFLYVAVGEEGVRGLEPGVYRYEPSGHSLAPHKEGDLRREVARAALGQSFLAQAPVDILMAADYQRTAGRYGQRATRYVAMEAGHIGENIYLQAEALGLGTVAVGAFRDDALGRVFGLPENQDALYVMPLGHPR
ncbi:MAG: SagB/ThcOx family dehydrogenase [Candidatus Brocadiia bacterium]